MGEKVSSRSIRGDSSLRKDSHKRNLTVGFNSAMTHHAIEPVRSIPGTYDLNTVSSPIFGYEEHVEPSFLGGVGGGLAWTEGASLSCFYKRPAYLGRG